MIINLGGRGGTKKSNANDPRPDRVVRESHGRRSHRGAVPLDPARRPPRMFPPPTRPPPLRPPLSSVRASFLSSIILLFCSLPGCAGSAASAHGAAARLGPVRHHTGAPSGTFPSGQQAMAPPSRCTATPILLCLSSGFGLVRSSLDFRWLLLNHQGARI